MRSIYYLFAVLLSFQVCYFANHGNLVQASCQRPKRPHVGIVFKPNKVKFKEGEFMIIQCHDQNFVSAQCTKDGWSVAIPECSDPTSKSCEKKEEFNPNNWIKFHYDHVNITIPEARKGNSDASSLKTSSVSSSTNTVNDEGKVSSASAFTANENTKILPLGTTVSFACMEGYKIVGPEKIFCEIGWNWSFKAPLCTRISELPEKKAINYQLTIIWSFIVLTVVMILAVSGCLICKWRQRIVQRKQWQRYFGDYTYRQSKTRITRPASAGTREQRQNRKSAAPQTAGPSSVNDTNSVSEGESMKYYSPSIDTGTIRSTVTIASTSTTLTSIPVTIVTAPTPDLSDVVSPPSPSILICNRDPVYANVIPEASHQETSSFHNVADEVSVPVTDL